MAGCWQGCWRLLKKPILFFTAKASRTPRSEENANNQFELRFFAILCLVDMWFKLGLSSLGSWRLAVKNRS